MVSRDGEFMQLRPRFGELLSRLTALSRHDVEEILHETLKEELERLKEARKETA